MGISGVLHCPSHGFFRFPSKSLLQSPRKGIGQPRRGTRPGKCVKVVRDALISSIEFHAETLLAALSMFRQSPISEAESFAISVFLDFVNDAAGIQGPES